MLLIFSYEDQWWAGGYKDYSYVFFSSHLIFIKRKFPKESSRFPIVTVIVLFSVKIPEVLFEQQLPGHGRKPCKKTMSCLLLIMNSHFPKSLGTIRDDSKKGALAWEHSASPVYRQRGSWPGKWQHRGHFQHCPQDLVTGRIILLPINKKGEKQKPDLVKNKSPCPSVRKESSVRFRKGLDSQTQLFTVLQLLLERKEEFLLRKGTSCNIEY